jgi:erythromycin esterase
MTRDAEDAFIDWARGSAVVGAPETLLGALQRMIGSATLVALGEADHFYEEPLEFRNRLFAFLVEHACFTAIAIESGIVEGRRVHEYVRGAPDDAAEVRAQGIGWTFERLAANGVLIEWLKRHNENRPRGSKVNFYGFDIPGSPSNAKAKRRGDTALREVFAYLERVDASARQEFGERLIAYLPHLRVNLRAPQTDAGYERLSQEQRDGLTATITDLVARLEGRKARYTAATSPADYEWAYRAAIGARHVDNWLRQVPIGYQASLHEMRFLDFASDLRDYAQAENLRWIADREGPDGRILVYAHNNHICADSMVRRWTADAQATAEGAGNLSYRRTPAGSHLRSLVGERFVTIGNIVGGGSVGAAGSERPLEPTAPGSIEHLAAKLAAPAFLLDLRRAPLEVRAGIDGERPIGRPFELLGSRLATKAIVSRGFDILFYLDRVCPATLAPG